MSSILNGQFNGTFTVDSSGDAVTLNLEQGASEIDIFNVTDWGSNAANTNVMVAKGVANLPAGSALVGSKTNGATTIAIPNMITTNGFTFFQDSGSQPIGAPVAITAITAATPAVASTGTTVPVGSVVRVYGTTGMLQIAGMDFSVTAVNAGVSNTFGYLPAAGFAAAAAAGSYILLPYQAVPLSSGAIAPDPRFYPRRRYITAITQASSAVVTLSVAHSFTVGEQVRVIVPSTFGMIQANNALATITAVNYTNNTITLNLSTTSFTAFAFPTSATAAAGTTFAQIIPVGEAATNTSTLPVGNLLNDATRNTSINGVIVGTGCLTASKTYAWIAKKGLSM
jgi:hypothetical protein